MLTAFRTPSTCSKKAGSRSRISSRLVASCSSASWNVSNIRLSMVASWRESHLRKHPIALCLFQEKTHTGRQPCRKHGLKKLGRDDGNIFLRSRPGRVEQCRATLRCTDDKSREPNTVPSIESLGNSVSMVVPLLLQGKPSRSGAYSGIRQVLALSQL